MLELRYVQELRGARRPVPSPRARAGRVIDRQWETRLLTVLAAVLVVFGLAAVYGASSLVTTSGGVVGASFALRQAIGAAVGGLAATVLARTDYRLWHRHPALPP